MVEADGWYLLSRLAGEASPYLRQHADNPVEWWPWCDEAFAEAKRLDRPVLVSVGYSACHWCHVMAHESFEDPNTAALLNARFVSIKVDREERPDIDAVYMDAIQAMTGQGGWPMTVFCTTDGRPFHGGTYFPPEDRGRMPSFRRVLLAVDEAWRDRRETVEDQASRVRDALDQRTRLQERSPVAPLGDAGGAEEVEELVLAALDRLSEGFDPHFGGFGRAPKFPQPALLDFLIEMGAGDLPDGSRKHRPMDMAVTTLGAMAAGGIRDHLGGGFARYSTDDRWLVPHFEKMAYDQAGIARAYLHLWQVSGEDRWLGLAEETLAYLTGSLADPAGGIHSAEDADSEGQEGLYYVWDLAEMEEILGKEAAAEAADWWGVTSRGNFEGRNILHRPFPGELELSESLERARGQLLAHRRLRVPPGRDDKVLTEWNAMAVSVLAEAAMATAGDKWARAAERIGEFLWANGRRDDGRWLRSYHVGRARHLAFCGDYAWLVDAATRMAELTGRAMWVERAKEVADGLIDLFLDPADGALFLSGNDAERLVVRTKELYDAALPAANSVAAAALWRLGVLVGQARYQEVARGILDALLPGVSQSPASFVSALVAMDRIAKGPVEIVIVGDRPDLVNEVHKRFLPGAVLAWGERYESPLWEGRDAEGGYVCRSYSCEMPAPDGATLAEQLDRDDLGVK